MAEVKLRRRLARALGGGRILDQLDHLTAEVARLDAELQEARRNNQRLAELIDVVSELVIPIASRDEARIAEAIEKFEESL